MCKKKYCLIFSYVIIYIFILLIFVKIEVSATAVNTRYVLLYDKLYGYAKQTSEILQLYMELKSNNQDVLLLQIDDLDEKKIEKDAKIIVISSSFDDKEKYKDTLDKLSVLGMKNHTEKSIHLNQSTKQKGLFLGIDEVYPFSDFNKLMDIAESLNDRGIEFICTIMPVYENYELEAYDKFIEVLKYVNKKGGCIFIHYPVINEDGTYDKDTKAGLEKAIDEYRRRGLEIRGIALSQDNLLENSKAIQDLDVQFLLITETKVKTDIHLDLFNISKEINRYIFIKSWDIDSFNIFSYNDLQSSNQDLVYFVIHDDVEKLDMLLKYLDSKKISIKDFKVEEYADILDRIKDDNGEETIIYNNNKTELDKFKEEELQKIRGENLNKEKENIQRYNMTNVVKKAFVIAFTIILVLMVQIIIAKRYDRKKNFKK
ncbi:DUF2334 domain-containing protein [Marinisporobacter balticus]|uniref:Uncharacterized protein DUF2334 n=1 Tax=Marinisporobacter balticus TaxID=2018667 RepID=A0A4R2K7N0_9FIRM|nr:DUF2334 domain-containing protein [Marinisporobacter balticus]TCO69363.1 uncharacterized protein DUF2334 [Marinisporobacter balticus]